MRKLSISDLQRLFEVRGRILVWRYRDPVTKGDVIFNAKFAGKQAGSLLPCGYYYVTFRVEGSRFSVPIHRIMYALSRGELVPDDLKIDHRDGDTLNNDPSNLRLADDRENARNSAIRSNNSSGFKGVHFAKHANLWRASLNVNKKTVRLGYFNDPKSAARAYDEAAILHHGEFARTNASLGLL